MTRKFALVPVLAAAVMLSACSSPDDIAQQIKQVQNYTKMICAYVPTGETVAKILAAGTIVDTISGVADAICSAVTTAPLADGPGDHLPRVNGVVIKGRFVR